MCVFVCRSIWDHILALTLLCVSWTFCLTSLMVFSNIKWDSEKSLLGRNVRTRKTVCVKNVVSVVSGNIELFISSLN